jgi:hypothetical protein
MDKLLSVPFAIRGVLLNGSKSCFESGGSCAFDIRSCLKKTREEKEGMIIIIEVDSN